MSDNNRIFVFDEKNKNTNTPKVATPKSSSAKRVVTPVDEKYKIDEKEFAPIIVDNTIVESPRPSGVKKDARLELELIVQEAIKRKEQQEKEKAAAPVEKPKKKPSKDKTSYNKDANVTYNKDKNSTRTLVREGEADINVKLRAEAMLTLSAKQYEEEDSISSQFKRALKILINPFAIIRPIINSTQKYKFNKDADIFSTKVNMSSVNKRSELEAMVATALQNKRMREQAEAEMKKVISEEKAVKQVNSLDPESGIGIDINISDNTPKIVKEDRKDKKANKHDFII